MKWEYITQIIQIISVSCVECFYCKQQTSSYLVLGCLVGVAVTSTCVKLFAELARSVLLFSQDKSQRVGLLRHSSITFFFLLKKKYFNFRAQLVRGFTLSDFLDKPWLQVSSLLPPGKCLYNLYRALGSAFPLLVDFHRMLLTHALALSVNQFF